MRPGSQTQEHQQNQVSQDLYLLRSSLGKRVGSRDMREHLSCAQEPGSTARGLEASNFLI